MKNVSSSPAFKRQVVFCRPRPSQKKRDPANDRSDVTDLCDSRNNFGIIPYHRINNRWGISNKLSVLNLSSSLPPPDDLPALLATSNSCAYLTGCYLGDTSLLISQMVGLPVQRCEAPQWPILESGRWEILLDDTPHCLWFNEQLTLNINSFVAPIPRPILHLSPCLQFGCDSVALTLLQLTNMSHVTNDQVVQFSLEEIRSAWICKSRILLDRIFSDNMLSLNELRDAVNQPWQGHGKISVRQAAHGLFEFILPSEASKTWVLQRTPWVINDRILHLQTWIPNVTHHTYVVLAVAPFRVQMWDVSDDFCTHQFGRKIAASTLGKVLEIGIFSCSDTDRHFVKVKVMIDFSKPLRSQIMATNDETGCF
ncbi:unnamed protein product [Linum trigynum]|uniref:DUF4283 domain-containing protein n=1 Tax=Linum trigynum TaxID=586398 RepID=A0AAV2GBN5_9ROSI